MRVRAFPAVLPFEFGPSRKLSQFLIQAYINKQPRSKKILTYNFQKKYPYFYEFTITKKLMETANTNTYGLGKKDILPATFLFIFWMAVYLRTLAPGLLPGDSGEFQILAYRLGHAHTTGYAVYLLFLTKLITFLPVDEIAFRVNLFSALMAGVTLVNVYLIGRLVWENRIGAFLGSTALGISFIFRPQPVQFRCPINKIS